MQSAQVHLMRPTLVLESPVYHTHLPSSHPADSALGGAGLFSVNGCAPALLHGQLHVLKLQGYPCHVPRRRPAGGPARTTLPMS